MLTLCCPPSSDFYRTLQKCGVPSQLAPTPAAAVRLAPRGSGVLVLAGDFPVPGAAISAKLLDEAAAKGLRLLIEYPSSVDGVEFGTPRALVYERLVTAAGQKLLMPQGGHFLPMKDADAADAARAGRAAPLVHLARLAGYDTAAFGLPKTAEPAIFPHPARDGVLISCCAVSRFICARCAPADSWRELLISLLSWADPSADLRGFGWTPETGPSYKPYDSLPANAEEIAFRRSARWFRDNMICSLDGRRFAFEGFESRVDHEGRQFVRNCIRGDCVSETAMVVALSYQRDRSPETRDIAASILDYVWSRGFFNGNPRSQAYGHNNWFENKGIFYGDDNARVIMGSLVARAVLGDSRWDEKILRCLLANLRTTNKLGFRHGSLSAEELESRGWRYFRDTDEEIELAPHYQGYLWAAFIWAYRLTGVPEFLEKPKLALRRCMETYPDGWKWTNSLTAEMARILLPLAFLVGVEDTPEHRGWLDRVATDLIACMDPATGAVADMFGAIEMGSYPPPQSNERYGTGEASIIQRNGDPATDLLYTTNWAFLGLHEAAAATGDARLKAAEDRLAAFLCRIQIRSARHPELDGAWMRSFDYKRWEYYGSSSDIGWGAWCIEGGWVNTWIAAVMAARRAGVSVKALGGIPPDLRAPEHAAIIAEMLL